MLVNEQWAFLQDVANLIIKASELGYQLTGDELERSQVEAWINALPANCTLIAQTEDGKESHYWEKVGGKGIQRSKHIQRLAIDLNAFRNGKLCNTVEEYRLLGEYWESLNPINRWGGKFSSRPDADHFERNVT